MGSAKGMARLPILRKQRSKKEQALDTLTSAARLYVIVKSSSAAGKAAKGGAKAYGAAKGAKVVGRPVVKLLAVPVAAAGGFLVWRKLRTSEAPAEPERPLGPVATPSSVSPPATSATTNGAGDDPPAGAVNPPVDVNEAS
jgi:NAD/NADP transhydrogenase alpha subunit